MRHLLIATLALATLAGCTPTPAETPPERQSAAGEVLGGEVSDEMLPLDTARSTSPAGRSGPGEDAGQSPEGRVGTSPDRTSGAATPKPFLTAAPMPDMTMPADPAPLPTDEEE